MREIKFRAWDKENREWWQELISVDAKTGKCLTHFESYEPAKECDFILMQYTGLKDSQVIDEYYGDIIISTFDSNEWELFVIEDGSSAVLYRNVDTDEIWCFWQLPPHYVIGNIYENPVLLT